jgi:galactose mutarotase-like enzyme
MIELRSETGFHGIVNPEGACVESWTAPDGTELLFVRRDMPSGKNRGGIPVCAPVFGPGETVGLNQHGFARNCVWNIDAQAESQVKLSLDNPASQVENIPPVYAGCAMELDIELLENGLRETLVIRNIGIEAFLLNPAFHPYFPVCTGDTATQMDVAIDEQNFTFSAEELGATRKIDSIDSTARLMSNQGAWTISAAGLPLFAIWSESPESFLCVEPTTGGYLSDNPARPLMPNESSTVSMTVIFEPNES